MPQDKPAERERGSRSDLSQCSSAKLYLHMKMSITKWWRNLAVKLLLCYRTHVLTEKISRHMF